MRTIAIIGAGFSGTAVSAHLLRLPAPTGGLRVLLFERGPRFARGVAYGARHGACSLNVPAGRMSAFPDDPDHFLRWARTRDARVTGGSFPARSFYGEYLESVLRDAEAGAQPGCSLERIHAEVSKIEPAEGGGATVIAGDGGRFRADAVCLALGNFPPSDPPIADRAFFSTPRYARDPWAHGLLESIGADEPVLIVGTGLTMLDIALSLKSLGHSAPVHALSRRGLLPQPHRVSVRPPRALPFPERMRPLLEGASGAELLRAVRDEIRAGARRGDDWREVVTSLRHETAALWRAMDERARRQFLRHAQPFWDTHRHRASPETAAAIADLIERGSLHVHAGRALAMRDAGGHAEVEFRPRGATEPVTLRVGRVINCTGPDTNLTRVHDPLLRDLRASGLVRPDALGLGLDCDAEGGAIGADGRAREWLRVMGPLRKGQLWESTAVPELRTQAPALARALLGAARAAPVAVGR